MAGGTYAAGAVAAVPSATIDQIQAGKLDPTPSERRRGAEPRALLDHAEQRPRRSTTSRSRRTRNSASRPSARASATSSKSSTPTPAATACPTDLGRFINDLIVRTLAGVPAAGRPVFLKIAYHGPQAMEELVAYDPHLVPGILGGSSGTTLRRVQAARGGEEARRAGRAVRPEDQQQRAPAHVRPLPPRDRRRPDRRRRRRAARITASWRSWGSSRTAR